MKAAGHPAGGVILRVCCASPHQWERHFLSAWFCRPSLRIDPIVLISPELKAPTHTINWLTKCSSMFAPPLSYMACGVTMVTLSWGLLSAVHWCTMLVLCWRSFRAGKNWYGGENWCLAERRDVCDQAGVWFLSTEPDESVWTHQTSSGLALQSVYINGHGHRWRSRLSISNFWFLFQTSLAVVSNSTNPLNRTNFL